MLSPNIFSRSRISRIIIYAIFTTTIFLLTAAGPNVAVFSTSANETAHSKTKPGIVYRGREEAFAAVCVAPPSGLAGWWAGDGNALDNKGTNHATRQNGASFTTGTVYQAFSFNGANQYLSIPQSANLPVRGTNSFTIDAWVNHQGDDSPSVFNLFAYRNGGDDVQFIVTRTEVVVWATTAVGVVLRIPHGVNPAAWNHYAITRNGNTWRVYVNGNQVGSDVTNGVDLLTPGTTQNIGTTGGANTQFAIGMIDEVEIFNRALSLTEIQSIYNAGSAGKCRTCVNAPNGQISMWKGESNALDSHSRNNGTLQNGTTYAAGKVGQAFNFDGLTQYVEIPDSPSLRPTNGLTLEGWYRFNVSNPSSALIAKPWSTSINDSYVIWTQLGQIAAGINGGVVSASFSPNPGEWYHIAYTYDEATFQHRLIVNGEVLDSRVLNSDLFYDSASVLIGMDKDNGVPVLPLYGSADEVSILDRALTIAEVQSIVFAGNAGKCGQCTPAPVGLVGWWTGDNHANDVRGGTNGLVMGGATYGAGEAGSGFLLNGTSAYIRVPDRADLHPEGGSFTVDAWIKTSRSNGAQAIYAHYECSGGCPPGAFSMIELYLADGKLTGYIRDTNNLSQTLAGVTQLADGGFHHVVLQRDMEATPKMMRTYVDGLLESEAQLVPIGLITNDDPSEDPVTIGAVIQDSVVGCGCPISLFSGTIDEVEYFNRALKVEEIRAIVASGDAGKCKPTAITAPPNLVAWWAGDGNVNDVSGQSVGGTLLSAGNYTVGKVGQGFTFNGTLNSGVTVPHHSSFNILAPGFTTEFWMKSNGAQPEILATLVEKSHGWVDSTGWVFTTFSSTNTVHFGIGDGGPGNGSFIEVISSPGILDGNFHHVAGTWDGSNMRLYVDGVLQGATPMASPANNGRGVNFGYTWGNGTPQRYFNGKIDEVSIYNRALSLEEIQSIYYAGIAGKLKSATTPIGFSAFSRKAERTTSPHVVNTTIGDATVTFPGVTTAGTTQQIPLDLTKLPPLPTGYTARGLSYDLASTAVWSGTPTLCFNVPALSSAFVNLRILHLENGEWADRTLIGGTSPNVCSTALAGLSPFALANVSPTAASVSVSGRVTTADGRGIRNARLTLTSPDGSRRTATTSTFGYYAFDGVEVGQTYVLEIASKRYTFANPNRVFSLQDTVTDMDFTSEPQ